MDPQAPSPENQNPQTDQPPTPPPAAAPAPRTEEELFQSANQNMELEQAPPPQPLTPVKKSRSKKPLILAFVVLLIVGAAAAAWFLVINKKEAPTAQQQINQEQVENTPRTYEPNTVAYSYQEKPSLPVMLYTRPVAGGERTEVQKLTRDSHPGSSITAGSNVAFVEGERAIHASTDHGKTYKKVFEGEAGSQVIGLVADHDTNNFAFAYLKSGAKTSEIISLGFNGEGQKPLFNTKEPGVFFYGWSSKNKRLVYATIGCWNCDGGTSTPTLYDFATKKSTPILDDIDSQRIASMAVSGDTSLLIYVMGVVDDSAEGIGVALKAPYEVKVLSLNDEETKDIATVGKAGEENPNGTPIYRSFLTGFTAGTNTAYYATGKQLFLVKDNEGLLFFESDKDLLNVLYISDSYVISTAGEYNDYTLSNYDVSAKKSAAILQGDDNTALFGITTD